MASFGIVSEGYTDQLLLEGILEGFFKGTGEKLKVNFLSPVWDETDAAKGQKAGWYQVFEYFKYHEHLKRDLQFNDYVIVQIDTDVSEETHFEVSQKKNGTTLTPDELVADVILKFQSLMGQQVYAENANRLIFAISVHSIECWLLPVFGKTASDRKKIVNCLGTLNKIIATQLKFTIDPKNKSYDDQYEKLADHFAENARVPLIKLACKNPSFNLFVTKLCALFP